MAFVFVATNPWHPWGGSEELWGQSARRMAGLGHRVVVSVGGWEPLPAPLLELEKSGVTLHRRRPARRERARRVLARLLHRPILPPDGGHMDAWLKEQRPRLVCISQGAVFDGVEWMLRCQRLRVPYVVVVQANSEWFWPQDDSLERCASGYRGARAACFVSRHNLNLVTRQIGEPLPNGVVVWNPISVSSSLDLGWPASNSEFRLASVARLEPHAKGQDLLFQVLSLPRWRARNLRVRLFGKGPCEASLRKLAASLDLTSVEFRGHVEDIPAIWRDHHSLILPSRYEGQSLALIEAMACARMPIVTDAGGSAELVEHGRSGFVARAPSVELLDEAMEEAWARRDEWRALGLAARARITSLMPPDPIAAFCDRLIEWAS